MLTSSPPTANSQATMRQYAGDCYKAPTAMAALALPRPPPCAAPARFTRLVRGRLNMTACSYSRAFAQALPLQKEYLKAWLCRRAGRPRQAALNRSPGNATQSRRAGPDGDSEDEDAGRKAGTTSSHPETRTSLLHGRTTIYLQPAKAVQAHSLQSHRRMQPVRSLQKSYLPANQTNTSSWIVLRERTMRVRCDVHSRWQTCDLSAARRCREDMEDAWSKRDRVMRCRHGASEGLPPLLLSRPPIPSSPFERCASSSGSYDSAERAGSAGHGERTVRLNTINEVLFLRLVTIFHLRLGGDHGQLDPDRPHGFQIARCRCTRRGGHDVDDS